MSTVKNVLCGITDIHVYPILALVMFVLVFAGSIVWAVTMKKSDAIKLGSMALDESTTEGELR